MCISCDAGGTDDDKDTKEKLTSKCDRKRKAINMKDKSAAIKGGGNKSKMRNLALVSKVGPDPNPNASDDSTISAESTGDNENNT